MCPAVLSFAVTLCTAAFSCDIDCALSILHVVSLSSVNMSSTPVVYSSRRRVLSTRVQTQQEPRENGLNNAPAWLLEITSKGKAERLAETICGMRVWECLMKRISKG